MRLVIDGLDMLTSVQYLQVLGGWISLVKGIGIALESRELLTGQYSSHTPKKYKTSNNLAHPRTNRETGWPSNATLTLSQRG
jgi:hypothetical protein